MVTHIIARIRRDPAKLLMIFTVAGWQKAMAHLRGLRRSRAARAEKARRKAEFRSDAWNHEPGYSQRTTIGSYSEYVAKQRGKLDGMIKAGVAKRNPKTAEMFRRRFELVKLPTNAMVVCLAAWLGDEVEAWHQLGHPRAIGIDLNPGPDNL